MIELQRAIFLRGVFDPADATRITTTLYRPKHQDLRYEDGFVRSGDLMVPLDNVVELKSISFEERKPSVETELERILDRSKRVHGKDDAIMTVEATIGAVLDAVEDSVTEVFEEASREPAVEEDKPVRRRGRPRKNPVS